MPFSVEVLSGPPEVRLLLRGELDIASAEQLRCALRSGIRQAAGSGGSVDLDLSGLVFLDCVGVTVLVNACAEARGNVALRAHGAGGSVRRVLHLTGVDQLLNDDLLSGGAPKPRLEQHSC